jgi:D-glycero-alpha-D-manno-heptose 1-phosphate guanylyltransferase
MITEAIVLAGGKGTRLQEFVSELPKVMAPVAGKPFISYVIDYMLMQGIQHFIFALGYKSNVVISYLEEQYPTLSYKAVIEDELSGTGGAIKNALAETTAENIFIINGDTLFKAEYRSIDDFHLNSKASCSVALKFMNNVERYGTVEINGEGKIISFIEKQLNKTGLINGGVYILNKNEFLQKPFPNVFSFEHDYLEKYSNSDAFYGIEQEGYFIDIGIPEDYNKANKDLVRPAPDLKSIDQNWSLFLDRDGVLNDEVVGKYILNWNEFHFSNGVLDALKMLSKKFKRIVVVSNQRGVGKSLMSEQDLEAIHNEMLKEVEENGGRIDKIYYCTETSDKHPDRKPNPGMALQAKE